MAARLEAVAEELEGEVERGVHLGQRRQEVVLDNFGGNPVIGGGVTFARVRFAEGAGRAGDAARSAR